VSSTSKPEIYFAEKKRNLLVELMIKKNIYLKFGFGSHYMRYENNLVQLQCVVCGKLLANEGYLSNEAI